MCKRNKVSIAEEEWLDDSNSSDDEVKNYWNNLKTNKIKSYKLKNKSNLVLNTEQKKYNSILPTDSLNSTNQPIQI